MLSLLLFTHIFFSKQLHFIQRKIGFALRLSVRPEKQTNEGFSRFGTLTTTLAATLGTGNIVGISTAIVLGGPGAVFWCWITGIFGMATTYAESYLSLLYRKKDENGRYFGGPMLVIEHGMKKKWLACTYAFFVILTSFCVGCTTQSNSIADTLSYLFSIPAFMTGFLLTLLVGFVLLGGFSLLESWCKKIVPFMSILYLLCSALLLLINYQYLIPALKLILHGAFHPNCINGGILGGAIRYGISRGLFTNEAGLGSAGIAAGASNTRNCKEQALVSMSATFIDTVCMCAITGLLLVANLLHYPASIQGKSAGGLTHAAFEALPLGSFFLGLCLLLFAFATLLGWSYFGQQAFLYLTKKKHLRIYQLFYLVAIFLGAILSLDLVWEISDTFNLFLAVPNLISLYALKKQIKA